MVAHATREMLRTIERNLAELQSQTGIAALSPAVREALLKTPREDFVPAADQTLAHADQALSIGCGQTISQPLIVALMTELLQPQAEDRVLEVGTGSGYQAAVLAPLVARVYSMEIIPELAGQARRLLERLGIRGVEVHTGNGALGLPALAPFAKIIIAAAAPSVPAPLLAQLAPGGLLVAPLGDPSAGQQLAVIGRDERGAWWRRDVLPVSFVPFVHTESAVL